MTNPLGTEKIHKLLFKFSIPTVMTLMVSYLYNIVDQIFVGKGVGITGIAATNIAFPLITVCMAVSLMIGDGCASNISLCLGRQEHEKADKTFGNTLTLLILSGILVVIFGSIFLKPLVLFFGATETVLQASMDYTKIIIFGLPFQMLCVAFTAIIRADGNPKYTMKVMIAGAVVNLILDPVFIFGLKMGVTGAGIATILGQILSGMLCIFYIPKLKTFSLSKKNTILQRETALNIFRLGIPSFCTQLATACVQVVMNNLMKYYGSATVYGSDIALSCYGTMMKVYQIAHAMFVGVSSGTQPINGFNYGAKQFGRVKKTYKTAVFIAFTISIFWFLIYQIFPAQIAGMFVKKEEQSYIIFASHCYRLYMGAFFLYGMPMVTASFFQSIGKPSKALVISLSRQIIFLIPFAVVLSEIFGIDGALLSAPVSDVLTFLLAGILIIFEFKKWKKEEMI